MGATLTLPRALAPYHLPDCKVPPATSRVVPAAVPSSVSFDGEVERE
jgi:hypothetical protein